MNISNDKRNVSVIGAMADFEFCEELKEIMATDMSDNELFYWLYSSTMAVYDIEPGNNPCSKGYVKRWNDLADIWGSCAEARDEPNLFMLALHRIHWGVEFADFPKNIPSQMVDEVEKQLLRDGECFRGWRANDYYRDAFEHFVVQYRFGIKPKKIRRMEWYLRYLRNRTWLYVAYKGTVPPTIDLAHYTREEFVSAKKHATIFAEYHNYKTVISKLIPEAAMWNESQWLEEHLLQKSLKRLYGVTMRDFSEEMDRIITFLVELWCYSKTSINILLSITSMPDSLMNAIWPGNTQREVTKLLCLAYSRVKSANTYLGKYGRTVYGCSWGKLRESWLYKRCREWVLDGELTDAAPRTKKITFEIECNLVP